MKTKGFTLVELLGVIVILAVIFILVFPAVTSIVSSSKETIYQKQINTILSATYDYTLQHLSYLPENNNTNYVTLGQLKYEGLIDVDIKNPNTNKVFPDNLVISIQNVGAGYRNSNNLSMLEGKYLYTVEIDKLNNTSIKDLLPKINLSVVGDKELIQNSDDNYIMILDLNNEFPVVNVTASSSSSSTDLTDQVKQYKLLNGITVNTIDTSKPSIYKINYSVVDENGYASLVVLNVIVSDTIPPTIDFPEETVISTDLTHFDLLKDVSCEDNSGFCNIEVSDEIKYGMVGTNTIEYTAKDPSGNTSTKKRVIKIE